MTTSETRYDQLVGALKDIRREGLNERALRHNWVLQHFFTNPANGRLFIERLILNSDPRDGLGYLIGAYAMQERFASLDLTRRRKMFADIIGLSERTLIRREDAAIEHLAQLISDSLGELSAYKRERAVQRRLNYADPYRTPEDCIAAITAESSIRSSSPDFSPTSDLVAAIHQSVERMSAMHEDILIIQREFENELLALQGLVERLNKAK